MTDCTAFGNPPQRRWSRSISSAAAEKARGVGTTDSSLAAPAEAGSGAGERRLLDGLDSGFCIVEVEFDDGGKAVDYCFLEVNEAFERQTGLKNAVGRRMRELAPDHEAHWYEIYGRIARTGEAERFERPAAALGHYYEVYAFRVGAPEERKLAILFGDISERKRAESERELLLRELNHRMKNILAVIGALARQTRVEERSAEEYRDAFLGRLNALAAVHGVMLDDEWRSADLAALAQCTLAPYAPEPAVAEAPARVSIDGPSLALSPAQGLAVALVLHELATNAAKHGALSSRNGHLSVSWQVTAEPAERHVALLWREAGGPALASHNGAGFGSRLIRRLAERELRGDFQADYRPEGLACRLAFRVD